MRAAVFGWLAALALVSAANAAPRDLVDACAKSAPSADDDVAGLAELEAQCPGLTRALEALGVGPLLPQSARDDLTRELLLPAVALASANPAATHAPLDRASLDRILPTLAGERPAASWWDRLKAWLRSLVGGDKSQPGSLWLQKWFQGWKISEFVASTVFFTLAALIIALAIGIVVSEMRASGVFGPSASATRRRTAGEVQRRERRSLEEIAAAPLHRRAAIMFDLLVHRLSETGRLGAVRDRTHRELSAQSPFTDPSDRERFVRLAGVAEEQLFSPTPIAAGRVQAALVDGEALIGALAAAGRPSA